MTTKRKREERRKKQATWMKSEGQEQGDGAEQRRGKRWPSLSSLTTRWTVSQSVEFPPHYHMNREFEEERWSEMHAKDGPAECEHEAELAVHLFHGPLSPAS